MQVTHLSDYDTHSIMGGGKRQAATINLNSGLITTLSTTLYSDNFLATVREVICNAWDSHKVSGRRDIPVQIELNQQTLMIRDFGKGIPHNKMRDIYFDYGGSTKTASEEETGGFGLGSKSPFSYTDFFNVENNYEGIKGIYTISRGSEETKGMPDMIEITRVPTTESGVAVEIPVADPKDVEKFTDVINGVVSLGGINATLNGKKIETIDLAATKDGVLFTDRKPYIVNGLLYVSYGNVIYPIKEHRDYATLYQEATNLMKLTEQKNQYSYMHKEREPLIAIFAAKPNSISVVPSREDLHSSRRTIQTVTELLTNFISLFDPLEGSKMILEKEKQLLQELVDKGEDLRPYLTKNNIILNHYRNNPDRFYSMQGDFLSIDELTIALAANGHFYDKNTLRAARLQRMQMLLKHGSDKDLVRRLDKLVTKYPNIWTDDYYCRNTAGKYLRQINPILRQAAAADLNPKNFIFWEANKHAGRKQFGGQNLAVTPDTMDNLLRQTKRLVMITPAKVLVKSYQYQTHKPDNWEAIPDEGCLVYLMPGKFKTRGKFAKRKSKSIEHADYEATLAFFKKHNYEIIDLVAYDLKYNSRETERNIKAMLAKPKAPIVNPKPKNSFIAIANLLENGVFGYRRHLDMPKQNIKYITNPVAVQKGSDLGQRSYHKRFFSWGDAGAGDLIKLYGDRVAIAKTDIELNKALNAGAKKADEWMIEQLINDILNDKVLEQTRATESLFLRYDFLSHHRYTQLKNTKSGAHLPDLPVMSEVQEMRVEVLRQLKHKAEQGWVTMVHKQKIKDAWQTYVDWSKNPKNDPLKGIFVKDASKRAEQILLGNILTGLQEPKLDPRKRAYFETLITMALFS